MKILTNCVADRLTMETRTFTALAVTVLISGLASVSLQAAATKYIDSPPLSKVIKQAVVPVREGGAMQLPIITWGGDIATILANGSAKDTSAGSIFDAQGLKFSLKREDDFTAQIGNYVRGDSASSKADAPISAVTMSLPI